MQHETQLKCPYTLLVPKNGTATATKDYIYWSSICSLLLSWWGWNMCQESIKPPTLQRIIWRPSYAKRKPAYIFMRLWVLKTLSPAGTLPKRALQASGRTSYFQGKRKERWDQPTNKLWSSNSNLLWRRKFNSTQLGVWLVSSNLWE